MAKRIELHVIEMAIQRTVLQQLSVRPGRQQLALVQDQDEVGVPQRLESAGDDNDRSALGNRLHHGLDASRQRRRFGRIVL